MASRAPGEKKGPPNAGGPKENGAEGKQRRFGVDVDQTGFMKSAFDLQTSKTSARCRSREKSSQRVASACLAVAAGAQRPEWTCRSMRIASTAGRRQAGAQ